MAAATALGIFNSIGAGGEKTTIRYVIEVSPIESSFTSKVADNDTVLDYETSQNIGKVSAVSASQAYHSGTDSQGSTVSSPMEGYSTLYITVTAQAVKTDTGYLVGNSVIGVGRELQLRLKNLYCSGKCVSIEVVK